MTLKIYDKKLLNFMYELTKLDRFYSSYALSKIIKLEGGRRVTSRTIRKWFKFLDKQWSFKNIKLNKFFYYPAFFHEKIGLMQVFTLLKEPKINRIKKISSFQRFKNYSAWLYDFSSQKHLLLVAHLIHYNERNKLKQKLVKLKKNNLIKDYEIFNMNKGFFIYSPLHKVIDENGIFHPELNDKNEIEKQILSFKNYLNNLPKCELIPEIKKNPLIALVLFGYAKRSWTSPKVWKRLKEKFGNDIWHYIKKRRMQVDTLGIKRVQQAIKQIYKCKIFQQPKIEYTPLELGGNNFFVYLFIDFKNKEKMISIARELAMKSIYMHIYPVYQKSNQFFLSLLINKKTMQNLFDILEDRNIKNKKLFFLRHERSLPMMLESDKFDYQKFCKK